VKLLLDTHVLLWCLADPGRLPMNIRRQIDTERNQIVYSVASLYEVATKRAAGRRSSPETATEQIHDLAQSAGYDLLLVRPEHAIAVETIAPFHGDPVDRLLLAQVQVESMRLVTHDERLASYDPRTILF
jgi:PIN domain nuclease of toxin-antitoxin system